MHQLDADGEVVVVCEDDTLHAYPCTVPAAGLAEPAGETDGRDGALHGLPRVSSEPRTANQLWMCNPGVGRGAGTVHGRGPEMLLFRMERAEARSYSPIILANTCALALGLPLSDRRMPAIPHCGTFFVFAMLLISGFLKSAV